MRLSALTDGRDNNFNLVRFVAAILVLFSHSFALALGSGNAEPLRNSIGMTWGSISVDVFFTASGFLICRSWLIRKNTVGFVWARVIRIWPGLIIVVCFCTFIVGPIFSSLKVWGYFTDFGTFKFFAKNIMLFRGIEANLPGVFLEVPYKSPVNGSLWTLPWELSLYAIIAVCLSVCGFLKRMISIAVMDVKYSLLFIYLILFIIDAYFRFNLVPKVGTHLFCMFFAGATYYCWRDRIKLRASWFYLMLVILFSSLLIGNAFIFAYLIVVPYLLFYLVYIPGGLVRKYNKLGDYSYGVYIYSFPVQQSIASLAPSCSVFFMFTVSIVATLILAILSWHLVEKKCLRFKDPILLFSPFIKKR